MQKFIMLRKHSRLQLSFPTSMTKLYRVLQKYKNKVVYKDASDSLQTEMHLNFYEDERRRESSTLNFTNYVTVTVLIKIVLGFHGVGFLV